MADEGTFFDEESQGVKMNSTLNVTARIKVKVGTAVTPFTQHENGLEEATEEADGIWKAGCGKTIERATLDSV